MNNKVKNFNQYCRVDEGFISRNILRFIFAIISTFSVSIKKIKSNFKYKSLGFKDKKIEKEFDDLSIKLIDYLFDILKYHLLKKFKNKVVRSKSLSSYIKTKTGDDVFEIGDRLLDIMKEENVKFSEDFLQKSSQLIDYEKGVNSIKTLIDIFRKMDDNVTQDVDLRELLDGFKLIDPRNQKPIDELVDGFDKVGKKLEEMSSPKELDYILDRINKYGIDILTSSERSDLERYSKNL